MEKIYDVTRCHVTVKFDTSNTVEKILSDLECQYVEATFPQTLTVRQIRTVNYRNVPKLTENL